MALGAIADRIAWYEKRTARPEVSPDDLGQLAALIVTRARFLGKLDDYGRALDLAEARVRAAPKDRESYLVRAEILSSLHRFDAAQADLDRSHELGMLEPDLVKRRITLAQARGELDTAMKLAQDQVDDFPSFDNLTTLAIIHSERGEIDAADERFRAALAVLRDDSPLTLARMCFRWGLMYEQNSAPGRARYLYEIAHARLPEYAEVAGHLAGHLAAAGETERARALLDNLVASTDDPEYVGQLADLENKLGNHDRAAALVSKATARYEALLARFPEAFADHAARYFLAAGNDPPRAYALARQNLMVRKTDSAYTLALESALRAGASVEACPLAEQANQVQYPSKQLLFQIWRAFMACGLKDSAESVAARLGIKDSSAP